MEAAAAAAAAAAQNLASLFLAFIILPEKIEMLPRVINSAIGWKLLKFEKKIDSRVWLNVNTW